MSEDGSCIRITNAPSKDPGDKQKIEENEDSCLLHSIAISKILRVQTNRFASSIPNRLFDLVHPLKRFSIVIIGPGGESDCSQLDFETDSAQKRDAIVSSLLALLSKSNTLFPKRRNELMPSRMHVRKARNIILSPMQRTRIYADSESMDEGMELSLHYSDDEDTSPDLPVRFPPPRRKSRPNNPFSFSEVVQHESVEEDVAVLEPTNSMMEGSFMNPILNEWCINDTCAIDLTDISNSLKGIFFMMETQSHAKTRGSANGPQGVSNMSCNDQAIGDSHDTIEASSCIIECLNTPATIWAEIPAPTDEAGKVHCGSSNASKFQNRGSVANAQAHRWRQLQTEMTFEAIIRHDQSRMRLIETTKSMDALDSRTRRSASSPRVGDGNIPHPALGIFERLAANLRTSDAEVSTGLEEYCYYDSDPEDARLSTHGRGPRRVQAERFNFIESEKVRNLKRLDFSLRRFGTRRKHYFDDLETNAIIEVSSNALEMYAVWISFAHIVSLCFTKDNEK